MPGSNFDSPLLIGRGGQINPTGPLETSPNAAKVKVYVWVTQPGAFMYGEAEPDATDPGKWVMVEDSAEFIGDFKPGHAVGLASQVTIFKGDRQVHWWVEAITLRRPS